MKKILFILFLLCLTINVSAQAVVHDKDKEKIIKSTEAGYWNFSPDWYMYFMHKDYSGAYTKWEWHGFKSGLRVHFKENKSNTKTVMPRRAASLLAEQAKVKVVEKERQQIEALKKEEEARALDRNVDLVYGKYKDQFNTLQSSIAKYLTYALTTSKGDKDILKMINDVKNNNEIVTSNIAYLRKTGVGYELENIKRDKGFRESLEDMEGVCDQAFSLARLVHAYFVPPTKKK